MRIDSSEVRHLAIDLSKAPASVRAKAPLAVKKTLFDIEGDSKILAPKDTTNLANSIGTDVDADGMGGEVGPTAEYGAAQEYGAEPHIIRARDGGKLAFVIGGQMVVFVDEVNHPGNAAQPYMGPSFDRNVPGLERALGDIGEEVL